MRGRIVAMAGLLSLAACSAGSVPVAAVRHGGGPAPHPGALRIPILLYHRVGPTSGRWPQLFVRYPVFSRQMSAIASSGARTLTIDQVYEAVRTGGSFDDGAVALTFDDGTEDEYVYAWPILRRYRLRATFYVATKLVGRPGYMTWAQLAEMRSSGLISVQAHTLTHPDLTRISPTDATTEIAESKRTLEAKLGVVVSHFAYPFGAYNSQIESIARSAGYITAVTTKYGWNRTAGDALRWGRIEIHDSNQPVNLANLAKMSGRWVSS